MMAFNRILALSIVYVLGVYLSTCHAQSESEVHGTNIRVKLYNTSRTDDYLLGSLEVSHPSSEWGRICDAHLTRKTATVVCRMFGYDYSEGIAKARVGQSSNLMFPNTFVCNGSETDLSQCGISSTYVYNCTSAGVLCYNDIEKVIEIRVVDGENTPYQISGRLEVRLIPLSGWGSVCDDGFTSRSATAVCRFMGYKYGEYTTGVYGSSNETLLDDLICTSQQDFLSCDRLLWYQHNCAPYEDVGVICMTTTVRLLSAVKSNTSQTVGSVEMYRAQNSGWFEVCDEGWNNINAKVVCRELKFKDGRALSRNALGAVYLGSLTALGSVVNVTCRGNESDLASCPMNTTTICKIEGGILRLAAVICYNNIVNDDQLVDEVRISTKYNLPNTPDFFGVLEIQHMGVWGLVCEDRLTFKDKALDKEASVVCRMKGYAGGKRIGQVAVNDEFHVWLRGFNCNGTESSITECRLPFWGLPSRNKCIEPVRVACYNQENKLSIRDGSRNNTGLLYLKHDSSEMQFCADNWRDIEANLSCIELGFAGGRIWIPQDGSLSFNTSTIMGDVNCSSTDETFGMCIKNKWTVPREQCNSGPAGVTCSKNIKIDPGYNDAGILQIYNKTSKLWFPACRRGFDDTDATVACKELGYEQGSLLPSEVFGPYSIRPQISNITCNGSETTILGCLFTTNVAGCSTRDYAAISCYNNIVTGTYKLDIGQMDTNSGYGVLKVFQNNTWGYVCDNYSFRDVDAQAYCSKVGQTKGYQYNHALKFTSVKDIPGPYFVTQPNCSRDSNQNYECNSRNDICYLKRAIYLICATSSAPRIHFVQEGGPPNVGRLQVTVNDDTGVICANSWTDEEAGVACRRLNSEYFGGTALKYGGATNLPFFLSGVKCTGSESSLFQCDNNGWKKPNLAACGVDAPKAGVACYKKVFLRDSQLTATTISGKLTVVVNEVTRGVCFDSYFTLSVAEVACKEMDYEYAALLKPADPNSNTDYAMMKRINCSSDALSITSCAYTTGSCYNGQVRLFCYKTPMNDVGRWSIVDPSNNNANIGQLRINEPELSSKYIGLICPVNFLDKEANATCMAKGFSNGIVLGSPQIGPNEKEIVWFGKPICSSSSNGVRASCTFAKNVSRDCFTKTYSAGVICFQQQDSFDLRLMDHNKVSRMAGRVEIKLNNQYGTVCSKSNDNSQARTFCRQKGFSDGKILPSSPKEFGNATGPIYLKDVKCNYNDQLFLGCTNAGWGQVANCTHANDLEISCYSKERFYPDPESHYGVVTVMRSGSYMSVCSDNFGDKEATVFCRALGYNSGKSICCSAMNVSAPTIDMSEVQCQGNENSLLSCSYLSGASYYNCPSQQFASAACSNSAQNDITYSVENLDNGRLFINHFNVKGMICAENFDQKDAQVACRHFGFTSGLAFSSLAVPSIYPISWTSNLECLGSESSLDQCTNFTLGQAGYCSYVANVMCFRADGKKDVNLRLVNGPSLTEGVLEIQINGTWGSYCQEQYPYWSYDEVSVICRQLGFSRGGHFLPQGYYGSSSGPIWLQGIKCNGSEAKIQDCQLERSDNYSSCNHHLYDAAVECYQNVRLINGQINSTLSGQLQIFNNDQREWQFVCDSAVTDRVATLVCKTLGYTFGKHLCCSAGGYYYTYSYITDISCPSSATSFNNCTALQGNCSTGHYSYVHCSNTSFESESLSMEEISKQVDVPKVTRFGILGKICNTGLNNTEARVMCREAGYVSGKLMHPSTAYLGDLIMLNGLKCKGNETRISQCSYSQLSTTATCSSRQVARILCLRSNGDVTYSIRTSGRDNYGQAIIQIDDRTMSIEYTYSNYALASIFCRSIPNKNYAYGTTYGHTMTRADNNDILMNNVYCDGSEETVLQCQADYFPEAYYRIYYRQTVYVECFNGASLVSSNNGAKSSSGMFTLYNKFIKQPSPVCRTLFGEKEISVACRMLGYEHGISYCCQPFGYNYDSIQFKNFKCNGTEKSLYECSHVAATTYKYNDLCVSRQDYVALMCYNGTKSNNFEVSIMGTQANAHTGLVKITYLNVTGVICNTDWDDVDAQVLCRQKGYPYGFAYSHYKSSYSSIDSSGPYWLSNVRCNGSESSIANCPHSEIGVVDSCAGHSAGVFCSRESEMSITLSNGSYGLVQVRINNRTGTLCDRYFDERDAIVLCRQLGYVTGDIMYNQNLPIINGPVYEISPRCIGNESNLNDCPHEGWKTDEASYCSSHYSDVGVYCYTTVRLGIGTGKTYTNGFVNIFVNNAWYKVCSDRFDDTTARLVCQELGFYDGRSICCSAYSGYVRSYEEVHQNVTLHCDGDEVSLKDCITTEECQTDYYASVACFEENDTINDTEYTFSMIKDFDTAGKISVNHLGLKGRICSSNWSDTDARVFCKGMNSMDGLAYQHSYVDSYESALDLGPFWISNVSCLGNESSLNQCKFNDRLNLGNCSAAHTAGAICFNDSGIQYRMNNSGPVPKNWGRIEMSLDNKWGTICGYNWDNKDARVACRNLNFTDGEVEPSNKYGKGSGPVWLRNVQCQGTEQNLHYCPHTGFFSEALSSGSYYYGYEPLFPWYGDCGYHYFDATVFCFKEARLNQKLGMSTGAILYNNNDKWVHVCDSSGFGSNEAKVACKSLLQNFTDGVAIRGGAFGKSDIPIEIGSISCTGREDSLSGCQITPSKACTSKTYTSVACFNYTLTEDDLKFSLRLSNDSIRTSDNHGILEIRENGAWGRICYKGFTEKEASVACKELGGFLGGVPYLHLQKNRLPLLWKSMTCTGNEASVNDCTHSGGVDTEDCHYHSNEAAVLCYRSEGISYSLTGGQNKSIGRVEIRFDGVSYSVCSYQWTNFNSRVLCKSMGYVDGFKLTIRNNSLDYLGNLMRFFLCEGNETNLLTCINSGFEINNYFNCDVDAYTQCVNEEIKITKTRFGDNGKMEGRVEIFVTGINQWGTVCDDLWDDLDALVVCQSLGFPYGIAITTSFFEGEGHIFLDEVQCNGTEKNLAECKHAGIGISNCLHSEDAGVRCFEQAPTLLPLTTISTTTTTTTTTTKKPVIPPSVTTPKMTRLTTPSTKTPIITVTKPTVQPTTHSSKPTETPDHGVHDSLSQNDSRKTRIIVAACVTIIVAVVIIAVIAFLIFKYRNKQSFNSHKRFKDDDVILSSDGSVAVANRMYDMSNADGGDPLAANSEIQMDQSGYVKFSKASSPVSEFQPNNTHAGFSNPLFAVMQDPSDVHGGESTT